MTRRMSKTKAETKKLTEEQKTEFREDVLRRTCEKLRAKVEELEQGAQKQTEYLRVEKRVNTILKNLLKELMQVTIQRKNDEDLYD